MQSKLLRVAIIEDDEDVRVACAGALARAGMEVHSYASCHAALEALARGELASLVVIDLEMPGESAFELESRSVSSGLDTGCEQASRPSSRAKDMDTA